MRFFFAETRPWLWQTCRMVRNAHTFDVPRIRALMESVAGFWQSWWSDETIENAISSAQGLSFVWENETGIAGFVCAHDCGFRAYLSELIVDPKASRQGMGSQLLRSVEDALRTRGHRTLIADVWRDAELFYRRLGWESPDVILLRRNLG